MGETILDFFSRLDAAVLHTLSGWGQISPLANKIIVGFLNLSSVKILPLVSGLWLLWFRKNHHPKDKLAVIAAFVSMMVAVGVARMVQNALPARPRPLHSEDLDFLWPLGIDHDVMEKWGSFPSDHAALAFALAICVYRASRPGGIIAFAWALLVVSFPRLFAGWHYASDIIGGAMIGIVVGSIFTHSQRLEKLLVGTALRLESRFTGLFYAGAFIFSYQIVTLFDDIRKVGREAVELLLKGHL
ncbi:phosphatase PAP2 family protein [Microvirga terricola]|uniref:Phosphatase PAP2 family protein n=1 Tax=Microvirga terricola TaxID=2719797 RepID=A0ABX0V9N1_9HYPH|nr:phosphatase PAP2 family protein [Microvirga terricola]NIX76539.1 phosphatase PAP2 family protein [Microvirga terricola]